MCIMFKCCRPSLLTQHNTFFVNVFLRGPLDSQLIEREKHIPHTSVSGSKISPVSFACNLPTCSRVTLTISPSAAVNCASLAIA